MKPEALTRWTSENSAELYGIHNWGSGYFNVSPKGTTVVTPQKNKPDITVDLHEVACDLQAKGHGMPILLRFADILASQVRLLNESFLQAIREANYQATYQGVYPIKVNQKQQVVNNIMEFGQDYHHGLEAGSKAELIIAVANIKNPESFIICNGYKDEEFIDLALYSLKMGIQTFIVIETPSELPLVIKRAKQMNVKPKLGIRAKLASRAGGRWDGSGGDRSKFGLNVSQVIDVVDTLKKEDMIDCLLMLHYHLGSQIPDIRRVRTALNEACRLYAELVKEDAPMGILNVGGGLAVDYDGSHTSFACSRNYSMKEYAVDVVEIIMGAADEAGIPHPMIVSESGRSTVAHHSVLIFNILDTRRFESHSLPKRLPADHNEMLGNLMEVNKSLTSRKAQEAYHDAVYYRDEIRSMFLHGDLPLRERALAENIFWHIIRRIADMTQKKKYVPDEMEGLEPAIADVYYGNFSLFQSLPDSWAIDHLFPVMPIHRLNEVPTRQAILADISCDSDGKIDRFIDQHDVKKILPLHELNNEEYYVGIFLVGAYQETLGDMHNLLGDINVIHIRINDSGEMEYVHEEPGDSVEQVLSYVEYNPSEMLKKIREKTEVINPDGKEALIKAFTDGMKGYTYFEK
ncbi:biosynthetic arginine decarboxylase [Verrucomicrobiota bacterium]